ncbi:hypothetical protein GWI33_016093 [Rhynchophorus ferrugineus]|uniref:Uncharacterized protein n=1 Tax=Rhynchophorus ferrugineus TaxID=354439 RepID=A0A834I1G9_RHYFE|nr:hypothetical protein GWI33_016093 [Rhynchophorus ferrugineus]
MWKRKIRDLLDYHERDLGAIEVKLVKSSALAAEANDKVVKHRPSIGYLRFVPTFLHLVGYKEKIPQHTQNCQNGVCERDNRTVIEMAKTLKYSNPEVTYPAGLWAE